MTESVNDELHRRGLIRELWRHKHAATHSNAFCIRAILFLLDDDDEICIKCMMYVALWGHGELTPKRERYAINRVLVGFGRAIGQIYLNIIKIKNGPESIAIGNLVGSSRFMTDTFRNNGQFIFDHHFA